MWELTFAKQLDQIRHGESLGNVSELVYTEQPDWKIPLSENGTPLPPSLLLSSHELSDENICET